MPNVGMRVIVEHLRRGQAKRSPDGELLQRFVNTRDEDAFAELVERHGPKVYAVCRRVLGEHQLAEDAFAELVERHGPKVIGPAIRPARRKGDFTREFPGHPGGNRLTGCSVFPPFRVE